MLDLGGGFRRDVVHGAVDGAFEGDTVLGHRAEFGEGEDLEAAAVGQDRARPVHEFMEAAELLHLFVAGAEIEVEGVAEDDLGV